MSSLLALSHGAEAKKTVLVLGDSIAAGLGVDPEEAYPALLQQKIDGAGLSYRVVNAGLSGDTTAGGLRRISWLLRQPIDVLFLELGGNDGLRGVPPEETQKNLEAIIRTVKEKNPAAKVIVAGMEMPATMGDEYRRKFRNSFVQAAQKTNAALLPFLLEGVGGKPELNQPDRIHPTPEGHRLIAEHVWKVLRPVLEQKPAGA